MCPSPSPCPRRPLATTTTIAFCIIYTPVKILNKCRDVYAPGSLKVTKPKPLDLPVIGSCFRFMCSISPYWPLIKTRRQQIKSYISKKDSLPEKCEVEMEDIEKIRNLLKAIISRGLCEAASHDRTGVEPQGRGSEHRHECPAPTSGTSPPSSSSTTRSHFLHKYSGFHLGLFFTVVPIFQKISIKYLT